MGTRGPAPKGAQHETVVGTLSPSSHLSEEAAAIFRETAEVCSKEGHKLSPMDGAILELYATARADAYEHERAIAAEGWTITAKNSGYSYPNPRVAMRDAALKRAVGAATKLGLSRLDRGRIKKSAEWQDDPFGDFVK